MRRCVLLVGEALSLAFAPAPLPKPGPGKDDLKRMQGEWEFVRSAQGAPDPSAGVMVVGTKVKKMVIAGDRLTYYYDLGEGEKREVWAITLDARGTPKVLVSNGDPARWPCIYRLDNDTLTFCFHLRVRPSNFDGPGPGETLEVWKRKKR
jgi:uncharacterized protein (TIGR03067 family)